MPQTILNRPEAHLSAVELEGVQPQGFRGNEAVRAWGRAGQPFFEKVSDRLRPGNGMVTARDSRYPGLPFLEGACAEVICGEGVEAAARQAELVGGLGDGQGVIPSRIEHMADEGRCVAMRELLVLFKSRD